MFSCQKNASDGLTPISVPFFCRETTWTLVLNQISERLSLVLCQSKVWLHFLWSKITHDHFTILWSRITHDHFVKILKLAIMIHDHFADQACLKFKHVYGGQIFGEKNGKYYYVAFSNDKKISFFSSGRTKHSYIEKQVINHRKSLIVFQNWNQVVLAKICDWHSFYEENRSNFHLLSRKCF